MGIYIKKRGDDEYIYFLYGKKQSYIGRNDDPDSINQVKLLKGVNALDKSMDEELKKYVENVFACVKYMGKKNGNMYLIKRKAKLGDIISKLK